MEERYSIGKKLGAGSFGDVHLIIEKSTGKELAMKQLKGDYSSWDDFTSFRELQSLMRMRQHPNIVQIHEVHLMTDTGSLFFVFEYMSCGSLYDLIMSQLQKQQQQQQNQQQLFHQTTSTNHNMLLLQENNIRSILQQTLRGLSHMHKEGFMHRDMKPENILLHTGGVCKVADFSLARKYHSPRRHDSLRSGSYTTTTTTAAAAWHNHDPLTSYVSTRWYRAPEVLLCMQDYGPAVDAFAMACIAAECFMGHALFPGLSEIDQLHRIFKLLGVPTRQSWKQGWELFSVSSTSTPPPTTPPPHHNVITLSWSPASHDVSTSSTEYHLNTSRLLQQVVPMASWQAIDLIVRLLRLDPNKRLTCDQALHHGFLQQASPPSSLSPPATQQHQYSLATVHEETSSIGEASAVGGESSAHVSPMSETPAQTVAVPSLLLLSPKKVAGATTASTVATTTSINDHTPLDIPMLPTHVNAAMTDADDSSMKSSHSFSSSSSSNSSSSSSSTMSTSSTSSMSSDSSDDDSSDDESIMSTQSTT